MSETSLQEIVLNRLEELRTGAVAAATRVGLERNFISDIAKGRKKSVRAADVPKLAEALRLDPGMLAIGVAVPVDGEAMPLSKSAPSGRPEQDRAAQMVPVRGTVPGALPDSFRFEGGTVDQVPVPPGLVGAKDLYAVFVTRGSMAPEHRPGDLRFIHPHRPYVPGDTVVVRARLYADAPEENFIAHYLGERDGGIVVGKLSPKIEEVEFKRELVSSVDKVMTVRELFGV